MEKEILESIHKIEERLTRIEELLQKNSDDCIKMTNHINFVHTIYDTLRTPLGYITNRINCMLGSSTVHLPTIGPEIK